MDFKNTNPAVIKSMFLQMDEATFIANAKQLKTELLALEITFYSQNYRFALKKLYLWCKHTYYKRFR